jgi:hypothetical protein
MTVVILGNNWLDSSLFTIRFIDNQTAIAAGKNKNKILKKIKSYSNKNYGIGRQ